MREEDKLKKVEQERPSYLYYPSPYNENDQWGSTDYIAVLWRRRYLILIGTLTCAATVFVVSSLMPKVYRATATLLVVPPRFSTELKPAPLSVEAYQTILESAYITEKLRGELSGEGIIKPNEGIDADLDTRIYIG